MLAGLVKSPSRLAPTRNYRAAEKRAKVVLAAMAELGFISKAKERVAMANPPRIVAQTGNGSSNYVADWVMDGVNDILGHVDQDIVVRTTINSAMQADAEKGARRRAGAEGREVPRRRRRAGVDDAGWRGARAGRRPQLRAKPI